MATLALYLPTLVFISLVGGFLPLVRELQRTTLALLLSFSAGVLLGAVFLHMVPEAGRVLGEDLGWAILGGFLLIFIMERFVFVHACEERDCDIHQMGIPAFLGISLHSLLDGIALGAGLMIPQLGPVVLLAVIIHKMPDSISISSILLSAGWGRRQVAFLNLLFSLTTPVGALIAYLFLRSLSPEAVAVALSISAGTFLAIATADILPQVHRIEQSNPKTLMFLLGGLTVSWLGRLFEL
ncbi:MAG TPA: ZIP family metal transporter [candidate division Zixibacteria bacterium]|nr:ZIP family metal transporter [candidate division Zixibacteria bacterium]